MGINIETLRAFSEINGRIDISEEIYSTKQEFKNILLYGGLMSAIVLAECGPKVENLPHRDSQEQRVYALVCSGCHDTDRDIPVIVNSKLAKSGKDVTVKNIVELLQTSGEHKPTYKGALSDEELRDVALWIIHDRLGVK